MKARACRCILSMSRMRCVAAGWNRVPLPVTNQLALVTDQIANRVMIAGIGVDDGAKV